MENFKDFMLFRTEELVDKVLALLSWLCIVAMSAIVGAVVAFAVMILNAE